MQGTRFLSGPSDFLRRSGNPFRYPRRQAARFWRGRLSSTVFVGVTGSHGKSTATALLGDILARTAPTKVGKVRNIPRDAVRTVLGVFPGRHRYCVQEVSGDRPGAVEDTVGILRPSVGIVTAIGWDHRKAFQGSQEAIAAEKAKLVHCLGPEGLAVLNGDDPLVAAMAGGCRSRVVTFGTAESAGLRLLGASSAWPERLSLEIAYAGEHHLVRTNLVGTHWSVSVLAALLAALELGVPMRTCLSAIAEFCPLYNRMSVHEGPNGAHLVLDANKSSWSGIETCLAFLRPASAPRKTVVFGTLSDYSGASRRSYHGVARIAAEAADRVIFTTPSAARVRRLVAGELAGRVFAIEQPEEVVRQLSKDAIAGEIIYVKATRADRLARIFAPRGQEPAR